MTEKELRADLIARWQAAFKRRSEVDTEPDGELVYAEYPAFSTLAKYSPAKFKPTARLHRSKPPKTGVYVFRLDAQKRPLWSRRVDSFNRTEERCIYHYSATEVELIEFDMQSGVPSLYNRLVLSGENPLSEQRFVNQSGYKSAQKILAEKGFHIFMTRYEVKKGVVRSAEEYQEWSNGKLWRPRLEYRYAADGQLERIIQHWPDGEQRILFTAKSLKSAKSKTTLADLSDRLSKKIAAEILARLKAASFSDPLVALELTYHEGQHHVPTLVPLTTRDKPKTLTLVSEIKSRKWLKLSDAKFADDLAEFNARVESTDNATAVAKMLRATARCVTEGAPAVIATADGFVAFAVDWELEGDRLATILKQCGADAAKIREWKKRDWI